jgi:hypothetical protein
MLTPSTEVVNPADRSDRLGRTAAGADGQSLHYARTSEKSLRPADDYGARGSQH